MGKRDILENIVLDITTSLQMLDKLDEYNISIVKKSGIRIRHKITGVKFELFNTKTMYKAIIEFIQEMDKVRVNIEANETKPIKVIGADIDEIR